MLTNLLKSIIDNKKKYNEVSVIEQIKRFLGIGCPSFSIEKEPTVRLIIKPYDF
jgi:hypothetical protein